MNKSMQSLARNKFLIILFVLQRSQSSWQTTIWQDGYPVGLPRSTRT